MFDWTVNVGHVLSLLAVLGTVIGMFFATKADVRVLKSDVRRIEATILTLNEAFIQLGHILTQVAVQDNRIHMLEKNIDELRHGQGFIK